MRSGRLQKEAPNCPHKLTKTAEPWVGGGAALGGSNCTPASRRLPVRSCHCVLVAAGAAPLSSGRRGGRLLQLRVITLGRRAHPCCYFARAGTNPVLRRFDRAQKFRSLFASSVKLQRVLGNRTPCQLDRLQKFRCVRTVGKPNFVLTRCTGEAAASRRTLRVLPDARRIAGYGIARVAVPVMLISATRFGRSGGFAAARYRGNARFWHHAAVEI